VVHVYRSCRGFVQGSCTGVVLDFTGSTCIHGYRNSTGVQGCRSSTGSRRYKNISELQG
jgi:hypothetical protein